MIEQEKFVIVGADTKNAELIARPRVTYLSDAWRRFKKNKIALIAGFVLCCIILMCIIGPMICPHEFDYIDKTAKNLSPSSDHWFGTDDMGRDLFARVWIGGRISLAIGLCGALICSVIGTLYGGIAAYFGGTADTIMMRIVEILSSTPYMVEVILLSVILGGTGLKPLTILIIAMCLTGWTTTARLVRGEMLRIKSMEYVLASESLGVPPMKVIAKHMIPNTFNALIVSITFAIPNFIFSEAFLSYVGLGVKPPDTSWGALCNTAKTAFLFYPYQLIFPGVMIALTMLCFTLMGDGLRDALDPKLRK